MTVIRLLMERLATDAARELVYRNVDGRWVGETGATGLSRVRGLALALRERGIRRGDRVAIVGETRPEWLACDLAILALGAVTVGVYTTSSAPQVGYILGHCRARAIFYDTAAQRAKIDEARAGLPALEHAIAFADLEALARKGEEIHARDRAEIEALYAEGAGAEAAA